MLLVPTWNRFNWKYSNWGVPDASPGLAVVPGVSNAEGSWTAMASAANIAQDVYGFTVSLCGGYLAGQIKNMLLDIGVDPAGGTAYAAVISNIVCGQNPDPTNCPRIYFFPMFIKAGSSIAVRIQGSNATAGSVNVGMVFYGQPSNPEATIVGQHSETIGTITLSAGVTFTPTSGSEGAWTSLGTTTRPLWWWQLGVQVSNGTILAQYTHIDLAYGDATNKVIILDNFFLAYSGTSEDGRFENPCNQLLEAFCEVPAGAEIFVRGWCNTTPATGYNAVAVGVGG